MAAKPKETTPLNAAVGAELTPSDAVNLLKILNRVQYSGMQEAQVAVLLGMKLKNLAGDLLDGKDIPAAD